MSGGVLLMDGVSAICAECSNSLLQHGCWVCRDRDSHAVMKKSAVKKKPVSSSATMPKKPRSVNKPASS